MSFVFNNARCKFDMFVGDKDLGNARAGELNILRL